MVEATEFNDTPEAIVDRNWSAFRFAYDQTGHSQYVTDANKFLRFYASEQWREEDLAALGDRPALTINIAKKVINAVMGRYLTTRADFQWKPAKNATRDQSIVLTQLFDQILEHNKYDRLEGQMVLNAINSDRGYIEFSLNFDDNIFGELKFRERDGRDVILDPSANRYDPATWTEVTVVDWLSLDDIRTTYGREKAEKLQSHATSGDTFGSESVRFGESNTRIALPDGPQRKQLRTVRVVSRQHRKMSLVNEFVDIETGDTSEIPEQWPLERVQAVAEQYDLLIRRRMKSRIRWTVTADKVLLHDAWSPYDDFNLVPFFPYFVPGKPTGIMRDLVSPQEQLNKTESQELHIVNTTANSGWTVEQGSLLNMSVQDLEERGAETGLVLEYKKNANPPDKIQPNSVPPGIDRVSQKAAAYISEIPGVTALTGTEPKSEVSGVALDQAKRSALGGLEIVFNNLAYTRELLAMACLRVVQRYYTEPRVMQATDWRDPDEPQRTFEINTDVINNITLGKYSVVVGSAPARDTFEETQFAEAMEMRREGVTIPDYHIIRSSHLANKDAIAEESKRLQGLAEPTQEEQELQQAQQELMLRGLQAEVAEAEAKAEKLMADTSLAEAKAQTEIAGEERESVALSTGRRLELQRLRADIAKHMATLMNKLELAGIHSESKDSLTRYTSLLDSADKRLKIASDAEAARRQSDSRASRDNTQ